MRIVWVNEQANFAGGAERYIADTAAALRHHGVESTLLHGAGATVEIPFVAAFEGSFPLVDLRAQLRDLQPDVVYVHQLADTKSIEWLTHASYPTVRFFHDHRMFCLREHKYTTIGHQTCTRPLGIHCYPCLGFIQRHPHFRLRGLAAHKRELSLNRDLSAFVVGSDYMRRHLLDHGFEASKTHVIPPGVSLARPPRAITRDPQRLLFVGALLRGKGVDTLLEALALLPASIYLTVVGDGAQREEFERLAQRLGLAQRVVFVPCLPRRRLPDLMASAVCVVVPSRTPETFGLVGPEALLCETPVVASLIGGVGEWLRPGVTAVAVPPGQPVALAAGIRQVLSDRPRARRMARAGKRRVEELFTPRGHAAKLLTLLRGLVKEQVA